MSLQSEKTILRNCFHPYHDFFLYQYHSVSAVLFIWNTYLLLSKASSVSIFFKSTKYCLSVSKKSTTLSKDKRNHCGKALFCVFPPIPPFRRKPAPQTASPLLTAVFLFKVSLRRHMSACVTNFKTYSSLPDCNSAAGNACGGIIMRYYSTVSVYRFKLLQIADFLAALF